MIRQDIFGHVKKVQGSLVLISSDSLEKMLGFNCNGEEKGLDEAEDFIAKIMDAGGDIINLDYYFETRDLVVVKKFTVNNEGCNQTILEIRPNNLNMTRFLMKGEPTSYEFFKGRIKELGLSPGQLMENDFALRDEILNEYKELVKS